MACLRWIAAALALATAATPVEAKAKMPLLKVSENRRFLVREDGSFFFYLGDTAWELFHRLRREDANIYLLDRSAKGFTVIQAVVLAEFDGLEEPNAYGKTPLKRNDPARPDNAYFKHVDWIVNRANELGLVIGMLPTWGDKVGPKKWGIGPEVFTPGNARAFGEFLGERYRDRDVIWILGGDRIPEEPGQKEIWNAMAGGIRKGDGGRHLMTYHPMGGNTSADFFHDAPWLDFNMLQSGHGAKNTANHAMIEKDYAREPVKPCLDGEPAYEDHPVNWKPENGWFDDHDVRKGIYWGLFAGAHGHTYGCHDIWQFYVPKNRRRPAVSHARTPWQDALSLPGSFQVRHARGLIESRPPLVRVPAQEIIASDPGSGGDHVRATRASDGGYAFIYLPVARPVTVRMDCIKGGAVRAWWYDPRTGRAKEINSFHNNQPEREFTPPGGEGPSDWVLVLDDPAAGFPPPGQP